MATNKQQRFSGSRSGALKMDIDGVESSLPPGFRFRPSDEELVRDYLWPKANGHQLDCCPIREASVYQKSPKTLIEEFPSLIRIEEWHFFSATKRKYENGSRPDRSAGTNGYWKATGKNPEVKVTVGDKVVIANKRSLTYMQGKPGSGIKTSWLMHEFTLENPPQTARDSSHPSRMKLDDCVLCKIYHSKKVEQEEEEEEAANRNVNPTAINITPLVPSNLINQSINPQGPSSMNWVTNPSNLINQYPSFCYDQGQSSMNCEPNPSNLINQNHSLWGDQGQPSMKCEPNLSNLINQYHSFWGDQGQASMNSATNLGYEGQQVQMPYDSNNYYPPSILQLDGESNQPWPGVKKEIYHASSALSQLPYPNYLNNEEGMGMELSIDDYLVSSLIMDQQVEGGSVTNNYDKSELMLYKTMESLNWESSQYCKGEGGGAGESSSGIATSSSRPQQKNAGVFPFGLEH